MAYYLVSADVKTDKIDELAQKLQQGKLKKLSPFGKAITFSLENARFDPETDRALWEEEDYCSPPLAQEKNEVLNHYFENIEEEKVQKDEGWERIKNLPKLWTKI